MDEAGKYLKCLKWEVLEVLEVFEVLEVLEVFEVLEVLEVFEVLEVLSFLLYRYRFGKVSWLVNITTAQYSNMIGQFLKRDGGKQRHQ